MRVKNWSLIISCYVLTLSFIHTTSTCIVRLGDICNALRYSNQYFPLICQKLLVYSITLTRSRGNLCHMDAFFHFIETVLMTNQIPEVI